MFRCFTTRNGAALLAGLTLLAAYLFIWHGAHVAAFLPFLLILACPLMHVFMHGGHGHHHGHTGRDDASSTNTDKEHHPSKVV